MRSNKRIQNKRNNNRKNDIFNLSMRIKDDIFEDDIFKLNPFEDFMNLTNIADMTTENTVFNPFELEQEEVKEEEKPKEVKEEKPKEVKEEDLSDSDESEIITNTDEFCIINELQSNQNKIQNKNKESKHNKIQSKKLEEPYKISSHIKNINTQSISLY